MPVWERLYDSIKAAEVPLDSPNWKNRQSLLTYYGNTQKLLELTANTIDARKLDDTMSKTLIPALMQEVRLEQLALIQHKRCELNARLCPGNPRSSANQTP